MSDRLRVYIAGPLSQGDRCKNLQVAIDAARRLIAAGFSVFVPHLSHYMDATDELGYDTWLAVDLPWVAVADAVVRLPGPSYGADAEVRHAQQLGIPVYHSVEALIADPPPTERAVWTRAMVLDAARAAVMRARNSVYGPPHQDFDRIAAMWSTLLGIPVASSQVAMCMVALKLSRLCETPDHTDSWVDIAGYAACGAEVATDGGEAA